MIDFSTLQGLTIPEGVVTQITDASGRVLWAASGGNVILEVEKITSNTYAGETTYTGEQFILLDIYPNTNGTVNVTYGGLTKTITDTSGAEKPNAQQVFFGTFNGVSDSVATPASGELTIEGNCRAFGCGSYSDGDSTTNKLASDYASCITAVVEWGSVTQIPAKAFYKCDKLDLHTIPEGIEHIGVSAFSMSLDGINMSWQTPMKGKTFVLPSTLKIIDSSAFTSSYTYTPPSSTQSVTEYTTYIDTFVLLSTTPPTVSNYAFNGANIVVPKGCGEAYKTASDNWRAYAGKITEAE